MCSWSCQAESGLHRASSTCVWGKTSWITSKAEKRLRSQPKPASQTARSGPGSCQGALGAVRAEREDLLLRRAGPSSREIRWLSRDPRDGLSGRERGLFAVQFLCSAFPYRLHSLPRMSCNLVFFQVLQPLCDDTGLPPLHAVLRLTGSFRRHGVPLAQSASAQISLPRTAIATTDLYIYIYIYIHLYDCIVLCCIVSYYTILYYSILYYIVNI